MTATHMSTPVLLQAEREAARLREAVAQLYDVFAVHPLRASTLACSHCHTAQEEHALHTRPLRELTIHDLGDYAASAMMTWGDEADFKHFLPRIFEVLVADDFLGTEIEVVFGHLQRAQWRSWPTREEQAAEAYLVAKWRATLSVFPAVHDAEAVLCAVSQSVDDLRPFLEAWLDLDSEPAARHLAALLWNNGALLAEGRGLSNAFWSAKQRNQQTQIREWLGSAPVRAFLERAFFAAGLADVQKELSDAIEIADVIGKATTHAS